MPWAIDEGDMSDQLQDGIAADGSALGVVFHLWAEGLEALRWGASWAFVKLGVCITQLDGDVSETFFVMTNGL